MNSIICISNAFQQIHYKHEDFYYDDILAQNYGRGCKFSLQHYVGSAWFDIPGPKSRYAYVGYVRVCC